MNPEEPNIEIGRKNPAPGVHIHLAEPNIVLLTVTTEDEDYWTKWLYVQGNPVRKGLVKQIEDWPYQGPVHSLRW